MLINLSMIICDFNVYRVSVFPCKANAPLVIYTDAVLTCSVAEKLFQPVRRGDAKIMEALRIIYHSQLSQRNLLDIGRQLPRMLTEIYFLCFCIAKRLNHSGII